MDKQLIELIDKSPDGVHAINRYVNFLYFETIFEPIFVICIFGLAGYLIFKAIKRGWLP